MRGRKTGRGFYTYQQPNSPVQVEEEPVREVGVIGVVGSGESAMRIATELSAAGFEILRADRDDTPSDLAAAELIVVATTSAAPVIDYAVTTSRQADVVGLHLFDSASETSLVEVVRTVSTADEVVATVRGLCRQAGWHPVLCSDRAGFIVDALLFPYLNDAVKMLQDHYASADDIDTAMKLGCRLPSGPFEVLDEIGLDVALAIQRALFGESGEPGLAPAPLLEQLVTAGYLGRKTGRGFRDHS
jgi:3-hydroxybutyryl-CoA dehydrogenase